MLKQNYAVSGLFDLVASVAGADTWADSAMTGAGLDNAVAASAAADDVDVAASAVDASAAADFFRRFFAATPNETPCI